METLFCKFCNFSSNSIRSYVDHSDSHSDVNKNGLYCGIGNCRTTFKQSSSLRMHLQRTHNWSVATPRLITIENMGDTHTGDDRGKYICTVTYCQKQLDNFDSLLNHLRQHMKNSELIKCPYANCKSVFDKNNSFSSHKSKKHSIPSASRTIEPQIDNDNCSEAGDSSCYLQAPDDLIDNAELFDAVENVNSDDDLFDSFLNKYATLLLKLECQYQLPALVVQYLIEEFQKIHDKSQDIIKNNLRKCLSEHNIKTDIIDQVIKTVFDNDPFKQASTTLGSDYKRKQHYKKTFPFVEPVKISIDQNDKKSFFYYVPITQSLGKFVSDKSVKDKIELEAKVNDTNILEDFTDGSAFKNNPFFQQNKECFKLNLFQDAFEIANPIGAAKKKYKLVGIYYALGNLPFHLRFHVNNIKLVALCKVTDFDLNAVCGKVVEDLKLLETEGIPFGNKMIRGSLTFISGDNLGQHEIAGMNMNFSRAEYFCRWCLISKEDFNSEDGYIAKYETRTVESYKQSLKNIEENEESYGVKHDSPFNQLQNYHVCSSGLAPCSGHDLSEGIIANDLLLIIHKLIAQKVFTLKQLNSRIKGFQYSSHDKADPLCTISEKNTKIPGGAMQVLNFLRLFPFLISDKIKKIDDDIWRAVLLLSEITEIVNSPNINKDYIPYLESLIAEYIGLRLKLFPGVKLRPKHHFLIHYPELILLFGPLIKVWAMRFESKHSFFKNVIRRMHNFVNVTQSLAVKHELLQCLIRLGNDMRPEQELIDETIFNPKMYSSDINACLNKFNFPEYALQCSSVIIKGTKYSQGNAMAINQEGYQYNVEIGKILFFIYDGIKVYCVLEMMKNKFIPLLRAYEIGAFQCYHCVSLESIKHYKPMHVYYLDNLVCIKPTCGFVAYPL